jgi:DNA-directed RNA polymerase III subunit RPC4
VESRCYPQLLTRADKGNRGRFAPGASSGPRRDLGDASGGKSDQPRQLDSGLKREGAGSDYISARKVTKGELDFEEPIYPNDGAAPTSRINIEMINIISDDEDDETSQGKGKGVSKGLRPIRLARTEHKDRATPQNADSSAPSAIDQLNTDAPVADDVGNLFVESDPARELARLRVLNGGRSWSGVWGNEDIKPDPDGAAQGLGDIMETDGSTVTPAPQTTETVPREIGPSERAAGESGPNEGHGHRNGRTRRPKLSARSKQPILQTEEDKAEYARHQEDVRILAQELGGLQTVSDAGPDASDGVDRSGRLYLFQFPPILPPLYNPVKAEQGDEDREVAMAEEPVTVSVDANAAADTARLDPHGAEEVKPERAAAPATRELVPEAGHVGRLVVRRSGKVELNWGGTSLALGKGASFDFLTTTLVVDGEAGPTAAHGTAMGKVMGKFVATPDWERLFGSE